MRHGVTWLAWTLVLWGGWVLLTLSSLSSAELVTGGVSAGIAALAATALHSSGYLRLSPRAGWLRYSGRIAWRALADTGVVLAEVVRRLAGRKSRAAFATFAFPAGGEDARSVARKALATAGLSLPPNTYVIAFDEPDGRVLVHQLVPAPRQGDDWRQLL
jgi:Na+/H+ ion antiporter subunit